MRNPRAASKIAFHSNDEESPIVARRQRCGCRAREKKHGARSSQLGKIRYHRAEAPRCVDGQPAHARQDPWPRSRPGARAVGDGDLRSPHARDAHRRSRTGYGGANGKPGAATSTTGPSATRPVSSCSIARRSHSPRLRFGVAAKTSSSSAPALRSSHTVRDLTRKVVLQRVARRKA
jgi:hypothetical protein